MKKLLSLLLVAVLVSAVFAATVTADNTDKWAGKLTIDLSDNEQLNIDEETATKLLTDGDFALNAEGWGGKHDGVVLVQNMNSTDPDAYGMVNLIWEFDETPEAYNTIKFGLYTDVNYMIGYPTEEDVFFSNDGVEWVSGYNTPEIGYGETIPDAVYGEDAKTAPGTVVAEIKLENPQNYKFVKIEFYYPKSPFAEKPRWEFFGLTEAFDFDYVEPSSVITDFNATEYWESRYGRGAGSFAFTTADAYAVAWENFITSGYTLAAFAPVEGLDNVYEVVSIGAASGDVAFPEGGFIWVAYNGAEAGSAAEAAIDLFATMTVGEQYSFTGIDFEKGFGAKDAKVEKYVPSVDESTDDDDNAVEEAMKEKLGEKVEGAVVDYIIEAPETYKAGDEITVKVFLRNITAANGIHMTGFTLYYDNTKLLITNDIDEESENILLCIEKAPKSWDENWCSVKNDYSNENPEGTEVNPLNDGVVIGSVFTDSTASSTAVKEDDQVIFAFTFKVLDGAKGDLGFVIPHAETDAAFNTKTSVEIYTANGSYAITAEATGDSETSEPETSEPETSEPETSEPETSEPETSEPETSEPETSEPETSEPETSEPETSEPETSEPATSEPATSEPATSEAESSDSEVTDPGDASGMIIFVIIALVAIAGSAIVVKNRK